MKPKTRFINFGNIGISIGPKKAISVDLCLIQGLALLTESVVVKYKRQSCTSGAFARIQ